MKIQLANFAPSVNSDSRFLSDWVEYIMLGGVYQLGPRYTERVQDHRQDSESCYTISELAKILSDLTDFNY